MSTAPDPMSPDRRESDRAKVTLTAYARRLLEEKERREREAAGLPEFAGRFGPPEHRQNWGAES